MASTTANNWDDTQFIDDFLFRSDITVQESQTMYKDWILSKRYDSMISQPQIYNSLTVLADAIRDLFPHPDKVLALDVGAGTGLTGQVLLEAGYKNIHGLEPQEESAEVSKSKGIYQKIISEFISGEKTPDIDDDTYDLVVSTGAFAPGHIPCEALREMARIVKPGGYVIVCMREEFLINVPEYKDQLEPLMSQMEAEGKWTRVKRKVYPHHFVDKDGVMFMFRIN